MIKTLVFLVLCWRHRKTPYYDFVEEYTLVLKAARRCAYDLKHCASDLGMELSRNGKKPFIDYHDRASMWLDIFSPTGGKDYRHELHSAISSLEIRLDRAIKLLDDNGIEHDLGDIPF